MRKWVEKRKKIKAEENISHLLGVKTEEACIYTIGLMLKLMMCFYI